MIKLVIIQSADILLKQLQNNLFSALDYNIEN